MKSRISLVMGLLLLLPVVLALAAHESGSPDVAANWPMPGRDPGGTRFSPLTQITPANVSQLKVAWVYHMKPAGSYQPAPIRRPAAGRWADHVCGDSLQPYRRARRGDRPRTVGVSNPRRRPAVGSRGQLLARWRGRRPSHHLRHPPRTFVFHQRGHRPVE